ncbi:MAG: hypothetical protein KJ018_09130 [Burkholderiales bacterium]|nr:hypothetical protein [Burkholderiales bacterium]GIK88196.1 MAG: hypothetical protein BroJett026_36770 [Betaproteobacteria bacterium]
MLPQPRRLLVRTADQTRRAELELAPDQTGAQIIQSAVDHWALPADADYALVNVTQGRALKPTETLDQAGVNSGDVLEVQPVLVAGG